MNADAMNVILDKIRAYRRILLFRHKRPDGDCVGATKGLKEILRISFPEKEILIIDDAASEFLAFMGPDDRPISDQQYADALAIVLDTGNTERISNPKYALCKEIIKIDHHIQDHPYGDIAWVEEERSSVCEMIAAFYDAFRQSLQINRQAAEFLYAGMVTDSGRFRYPGVTGETLRLAGMLLDQGVDTQKLYANLYLKEFDALRFQAYVYQHMGRTEHGAAYILIDRAAQREFNLSFEDASAAISYLDGIKGCICWLAFIWGPEGDESIRVRLRSRFMTINALACRYRGGGHACASGATVLNQQEIDALIRDADALAEQYKAAHDDWL